MQSSLLKYYPFFFYESGPPSPASLTFLVAYPKIELQKFLDGSGALAKSRQPPAIKIERDFHALSLL